MEVLPITDVLIDHVSRFEHTESSASISSHEFVHRDSMVSIRLSDPHTLREDRPTSEVPKVAQCRKVKRATVRFEEMPPLEKVEVVGFDAALHDKPIKLVPASVTSRPASVFEPSDLAESEPELESGILHVRTGSIDSSSSGESAHVDWEVLDKNEKQEQQDEGSDDVREKIRMDLNHFWQTNGSPSLQLSYLLDSSEKTTHSLLIPRLL